MTIAVVDKSTLLASKTTEKQLMCEAITTQLRSHAGPAWRKYSTSVKYYAPGTTVPASYDVVYLFDDADQAGALGYHDETPQGKPYAKVFVHTVLSNGGTILSGELSVSSVLSHEVLEMYVDENVNLWADDFNGTAYALEVGDPVESDSYNITTASGVQVAVSNFVYPAWFDAQAAAGSKFDRLGKVTRPFQMTPGGYVIVMQEGQVTQKFGEGYPEWRKEMKKFPASRTARRG